MPTVSRGIKIRLQESKPRATNKDQIKNESIKKSKFINILDNQIQTKTPNNMNEVNCASLVLCTKGLAYIP
jgi:hypothetical protein